MYVLYFRHHCLQIYEIKLNFRSLQFLSYNMFLRNFEYQKALIPTFNTSFSTTKEHAQINSKGYFVFENLLI